MTYSFETLYPPKDDDIEKSEVPNLQNRTYEYVTYEEALKNLELSSENHLNEKKFMDFNDYRTTDFDDEFTEALQPFFRVNV
ncbi:hypothetical protein JTE90_025175 [Oedothorax gibbosus]|uniref:Uncharacterized protein n=1 Tax=Oedothorax gibbosus TaxID=931172 RepID=A0AAV6UHH3_9ARAC|nr:hypothetical protein JTE90_025175 [Oedothorax gibbosus]